jgi:biotin operon repressor
MALPGFSISDLIQALSQAKIIYDAFFNEYTSSAAQVRDLAEEIESFRRNLNKHRQVLEVHGLEYEGFTAVYRTLNSCHNFLDKYKIILDQQRRKSVAATYKTAKFVFDLDEVNRLRDQIHRHDSNILHHSLNIILCVRILSPSSQQC